MRKKLMQAAALTVSAAMIVAMGSGSVLAQGQLAPASKTIVAESPAAPTKDETVYILAGADGKAQKLLVSSWLKNTGKEAVLSDCSTLADIENVKGDEPFTAGADGALSWNASGEDIYYQGTSSREAPVSLHIRYTLDGKDISPEALAGKSGRVTMRIDYENNETVTVKTDSGEETVHVPFAMLTGMMLDTDIFRNVEVTNGRMENLGNTTVVAGLALPGLQEDLQLDRETLELPDYVEISADVTGFAMEPTFTVATTALFKELDGDRMDPGSLRDSLSKLTDGMTRLMDGSAQLNDGLNTLLEQSGVLVEGVDRLYGGAVQLKEGVSALTNGADQLKGGAAQLSEGLGTLDKNSPALRNGAKQVFQTLLSTAKDQLTAAGLEVPALTIDNYAEVLTGIIGSLDESKVYEAALQQVTEGVNARREEIVAGVTAAVRQQVESEVQKVVIPQVREAVAAQVQAKEPEIRAIVIKKATGLTPKAYELAVKAGLITKEQQAAVDAAVKGAIADQIEQQMASEAVKAKIDAITKSATDEKMASPEIEAVIADQTEKQVEKLIAETMASPEVQEKLQAAAEGAKAVIGLKSSLDSYNAFYLGLLTYTDGVAQAVSGALSLKEGAAALSDGMGTLSGGVNALADGIGTMHGQTPALTGGITQLRDGSAQLREGLVQMMNEGIGKISALADDKLEPLARHLSACVKAAGGYDNFSGLAEGSVGTVRFIIKTDSISKE